MTFDHVSLGRPLTIEQAQAAADLQAALGQIAQLAGAVRSLPAADSGFDLEGRCSEPGRAIHLAVLMAAAHDLLYLSERVQACLSVFGAAVAGGGQHDSTA
jgi:hypothetical protein